MSISAVSSNQQLAYTQLFSSQPVGSQNSVTGTQPSTSNSGGGSNFFQAISSALQSLGASSSSSTSSTASASATSAATGTSSTSGSQSPQQALDAFLQSLVAAIQSQVSGQSGSSSSTASAGGGGHHHHHGGGGIGKVEAGIQDILQQLTAGSGSTTSAATGTLAASTTGATAATGTSAVTGTTAATGTSATTNGTIASLQSSFNNLLSADGISSSGTSLSSFLQTLEKNLQGSSVSGNVVQTQA